MSLIANQLITQCTLLFLIMHVTNICFSAFVIKVPDDFSDEPKDEIHITLKCCACILQLYLNIVYHNGTNQNKIDTYF
jgi:hypothetical protein